MRWIVIQCAQRGVQSHGSLREFYLRLKDKKGHKIAIVATARKLLEVVWAVLTKKEQYRELRIDLLKRKLNAISKKGMPYPEKDNLRYVLDSFNNMESLSTNDEIINFGLGNFCLSLVGYPKDLIPSRKERLDRIKSLECGLGRKAKEKT